MNQTHAKIQTISSFCSRDIFDLKILKSDWPRPFWPNLTETQTNRFTAFAFGQRDEREKRWKKAKNRFDHHEVKLKLYGAKSKHLTTLKKQHFF